MREVRELALELRSAHDRDDRGRGHEHLVETIDPVPLGDGPRGSLGEGAQEPLLDVGEVVAPRRSDLRHADHVPVVHEGNAEQAAKARPRRGRVAQKKGLAGDRDHSRQAGAGRHGAADLLRRSADGSADAEQLSFAEEDGRRVRAVGGLEEDAEELREQGRQAALLERGAGDALEGDETRIASSRSRVRTSTSCARSSSRCRKRSAKALTRARRTSGS